MATVQVHHYSKERHTLVLNCHPVASTDTSTEVTLQLQDKEQTLRWLKALQNAIFVASGEQQKHTDRALGALNSFLMERMFLRSRQVGDTSALEKEIWDKSTSEHLHSPPGDEKVTFDAEMNLESKIWKSPDYDTRVTSEVYEKFGRFDHEHDPESFSTSITAANNYVPHETSGGGVSGTQPNTNDSGERAVAANVDDDYDIIDIPSEKRSDSGAQSAHSTSLTSYFGSVASALYNNAEASLVSTLTGSSGTGSGSGGSRSVKGRGSRKTEVPLRSRQNSDPIPSSHFNKDTENETSTLEPLPSSPPAPAFAGHSSVALMHYNFPVPKLRILIMAVGTRGDVQPLALLGMQLLRDGHRVRLATHGCYREFVISFGGGGLEFYPLGGDPVKLSEFMVKTHGCILPSSPDILKLVPENLSMLSDIIHSCWGACVDIDPGPIPDGESGRSGLGNARSGRKFQADAIISNPVTYGHIHCAEALGVPLHLFFPQPWVPTKAFPHPLACMSYGKDNQWSTENYLSYQLVERMMWMSLEPCINIFRTTKLNLPPIRRGQHGWNLLNTHKVPFVKMWSKYLVPVPKDWGPHVDVVGFFLTDKQREKGRCRGRETVKTDDDGIIGTVKGPADTTPPVVLTSTSDSSATPSTLISTDSDEYQPCEALKLFLDTGSPPVFVGFGSMVVEDASSLIQILLDGAAVRGVRMLVQSGWSEISDDSFQKMTASAAKKARSMTGTATSSAAGIGTHSETGRKHNNTSTESDVDHSDVRNVEEEGGGFEAMLIGALPHDWLFPFLKAVIHHGGAGTTAAGLCAGKPTMICPFFGDQHFWGHMVYQAGVGPKPCSVHELTAEKVAAGLAVLLSEEASRNTRQLSLRMNSENGVMSSLDSFYTHLHLENMICDVSIFHGESRLAQVWCRECGLKMNKEVCDLVHDTSNPNTRKILGTHDLHSHHIEPCVSVNWSESREPLSTTEGLLQGVGGATHELVGGISDAILEPISALYHGEGVKGAVGGVVNGLQGLVIRPMTGGFLLYNKVSKGIKESLHSRGTDIESRRQALPDAQRTFSRPGGIARQGDSVYGAAAMSDVMGDVSDDVFSCEGRGEGGALLVCEEGNEEEGDVRSEEDEQQQQHHHQQQKEEDGSRREDTRESADVLALDDAMQKALQQSNAGAFISDVAVAEDIHMQMANLFHSFTGGEEEEGRGLFGYNFDSGSEEGADGVSPVVSVCLEGSDVIDAWEGGGSHERRETRVQTPEGEEELSDPEVVISPFANFSSEDMVDMGEEAGYSGNDSQAVRELHRSVEAEELLQHPREELGITEESGRLAAAATGTITETSDVETVTGTTRVTALQDMKNRSSFAPCSGSSSTDISPSVAPPLLFNSLILTDQRHVVNERCKRKNNIRGNREHIKTSNSNDAYDGNSGAVTGVDEGGNDNADNNGSSGGAHSDGDLREEEILNAFRLAKKIQQTLEEVIGFSSRFVTFEDFATLLAQAMGNNWHCSKDEDSLRAVTLKLAQNISEKKQFLDFVDFSLLFLSMQDEISWKDPPQRVVGKRYEEAAETGMFTESGTETG